MPGTVLPECQKGNCANCPGEAGIRTDVAGRKSAKWWCTHTCHKKEEEK
jgi:hypothetical protein